MPHTGADGEGQVDRVCHEEQMTIWTGEIAGSLSMGGYLREDLSYDDKLDLHAVIAKDLRDIVGSALTHPALHEAEAPDPLSDLMAKNEKLKAALTSFYAWYDRDGSVGGASDVFAEHRHLIASTEETHHVKG